eukprot:COSAG06_NODE_6217_length_3044_cov_23.832008_5_plen_92_part_00
MHIQSYCPNVKVISVNGVGYDGVDVAAVTDAGIFLANAPVLRDACADMAMLLMLAVRIHHPSSNRTGTGTTMASCNASLHDLIGCCIRLSG